MQPRDVQGWLSEAEGEWLTAAAADIPLGLGAVEIGSAYGRSTCYIARGLGFGCLIAVDNFSNIKLAPNVKSLFRHNLEAVGVAARVRLWDMDSNQAARRWPGQNIGLLFIDGDHERAGLDLMVWFPHVAIDGVVAFHDAKAGGWPDVVRAVDQYRFLFDEIEAPDSLWAGRKRP